MTSLRPAQTTLRLDTPAQTQSQSWQDGASVYYLGRALRLCLDTSVEDAARLGDELHLPLPPQATTRQVQDRAEAWLRQEAQLFFADIIAQRCARSALAVPKIQLSFATRSGWTEVESGHRGAGGHGAGKLRINWRLIELAPEAIEQVLGSALASLHTSVATPDLFAA